MIILLYNLQKYLCMYVSLFVHIFKALLHKNHTSYLKSKVTSSISEKFFEKNLTPIVKNTNFVKTGHTVPQNDRWNLTKKSNYNFFLCGHLHGVTGQNVHKMSKTQKNRQF